MWTDPCHSGQELVGLEEEAGTQDKCKDVGSLWIVGGGRDEKVNECIQGTCHQNPFLVHQFLHSKGGGGAEEEGGGAEVGCGHSTFLFDMQLTLAWWPGVR